MLWLSLPVYNSSWGSQLIEHTFQNIIYGLIKLSKYKIWNHIPSIGSKIRDFFITFYAMLLMIALHGHIIHAGSMTISKTEVKFLISLSGIKSLFFYTYINSFNNKIRTYWRWVDFIACRKDTYHCNVWNFNQKCCEG